MRILSREEANFFIKECISVAKKATCSRFKCGSIIVKDGKIIGSGFNSPPKDLESQRRCFNSKADYDVKVTDKTCCVHAEQRAMFDSLRRNPKKIKGSTLYFVRINEEGEVLFAGKPYCTICSKMALDIGIKEFVLFHEDKAIAYEVEEYNNFSYGYFS
ncbi:hypothetical protein GW932_01390 [archaeon]|nr:hypothetical protein [archaeon]